MNKLFHNEKVRIMFLCFLLSFFFLAITSKSSFLYYINNWTDANCFFTMGKGLLHNQIYYLDLFDQKGPLLYFYHTIAAVISYRSFLGVYLIEVLSFSFFLYYSYRFLRLFLEKNISLYCLPIISFVILTLPSFTHGDSAEEFCLPFLMFGLYSLVRFFKEKSEIPSYSFLFINGILAGVVFTIKYTLLGFWFALMMCLFFSLIKKKKVKRAFLSCLVFLGGMILPIIPWIIYFISQDAFQEFFFSYFTFNLQLYPSQGTFFSHFIMAMAKPLRFMAQNLGVGIFFFMGAFALCLDKKFFKKRSQVVILITTFVFLSFSVFVGGISFRYYYLILTPYLMFGVVVFAQWLDKAYSISRKQKSQFLLLGFCIFLLSLTFLASKNVEFMKIFVKREDLVQYQFAKIINQKKNPTILNYHFLDGGFYTATGTLPINRYFQKQNLPDQVFPDITKQQNKLIKESKVDFVITRKRISSYDPFQFSPELSKNYHIVSKKNEAYEEKRFQYILWKKNSSI